jgi:hypothetical protein
LLPASHVRFRERGYVEEKIMIVMIIEI